jgi:hypothetical protein
VGRPSLGDQARNIQQGTKVSKDEIKWLEGLHGSAHKGLRAALDFYKLERMRHTEGAEDYAAALDTFAAEPATWQLPADYRPTVDVELPEPPEPTGPRPVVPVDEEGTPIPCRIHREWETIDEFFDKGVAMREKRCVKCGHVVVQRAA